MTYFIATRDGYPPKLLESEQIAKDLARTGWTVVRVVKTDRRARRGSNGGEKEPCAFCDGYGDVVNPGNGDPAIKVTDWLAPVGCPRCGQTGKEPNP